jgi:hypothetical protein
VPLITGIFAIKIITTQNSYILYNILIKSVFIHISFEVQTCTTSRFGKNEDPLLCPHGYICHVMIKGNRKKRIQNRGYCVPEKDNGRY